MKSNRATQCERRLVLLPLAISLALLICQAHLIKPTLAQTSSSSNANLSNGGSSGSALSASASGSLSTGSGGGLSGSFEAGAQTSSSGGSSSSLASGNGSSGGSSLSGSASASASGGSSSSTSGSGSILGGGGGGGGASGSDQSVQVSASISLSSTTPKPEGGLLSKVKEIIKEGKEAVKNSVDILVKDDKKPSTSTEAPSLAGGSSSGLASASASGSISGESGSGSSQASAQVSMGQKQEGGLMDKLSDVAKKGKGALKESASVLKEKINDFKDQRRSSPGSDDQQPGEGGMSVGGSIKIGGLQASANLNSDGASGNATLNEQQSESSGPVDKLSKLVNKGTQVVRETVHKIEDKAAEVSDKVSKSFDDNIRRPMSQVSGSGQQTSEGQMTAQASVNVQLKGEAREKHLMDLKQRQENELGQKPSNLKEIISQAKVKGVIPKKEDRSALAGNHADEKSVAVEVIDKVHELSKIPVEQALKPLDKVLGYEKDPLIRMYDNSHEILRAPINFVSKPVDSMLTGAFKTTDEAKRDNEKLLQTTSEEERREARRQEEISRKEDRSVVGTIADKTVELAEKPFEIILKPIDHVLGFDKQGKKNPLLKIFDDIYSLSKKPLDALAKPFENILRKMADGEQAFQVSLRFQSQAEANAGGQGSQAQASARVGLGSDKSSSQVADPKLVTRLADGALNIADRVLTKPLEIVMKPLNHALGYDEPGKKNPIVGAAHSLKNATKVGVELFTRPIDRIIKEIAEIGAIKNDAEREAMIERKRDEASRLVKALDKLHEFAQAPWEVVLRPVSRVLGISKEGHKEPLLRAWDVVHQVIRAPIQVVSKPVEDAILGEQPRRAPNQRAGADAQIDGKIGSAKVSASGLLRGSGNGSSANANAKIHLGQEEPKKNFIVDTIKKVEKMAAKPLDVITSPIRRLILGEDDEKVGSDTDKNNRMIQAKAMGQSGNGRTQAQASINGESSEGPDKIVKTIENMNNLVLKPIEAITQPIADIFSDDKKQSKPAPQQQQQGGQNNIDSKGQGQSQNNGGGQNNKISVSAQAQVRS